MTDSTLVDLVSQSIRSARAMESLGAVIDALVLASKHANSAATIEPEMGPEILAVLEAIHAAAEAASRALTVADEKLEMALRAADPNRTIKDNDAEGGDEG